MPEALGINQAHAFHLLSAGDHDYLLVAEHQPGSTSSYGCKAFFDVTDG